MTNKEIDTYLLPLMTRVRDVDHTPCSGVGMGGYSLRSLAPGDRRSLDEHYLVLPGFIHAGGQGHAYIESTLRKVMCFVNFTSHIEGHSTTGQTTSKVRGYVRTPYLDLRLDLPPRYAINVGRCSRLSVELER